MKKALNVSKNIVISTGKSMAIGAAYGYFICLLMSLLASIYYCKQRIKSDSPSDQCQEGVLMFLSAAIVLAVPEPRIQLFNMAAGATVLAPFGFLYGVVSEYRKTLQGKETYPIEIVTQP